MKASSTLCPNVAKLIYNVCCSGHSVFCLSMFRGRNEMSQRDRETLRTNAVFLLENLTITERLLGGLLAKGVLTSAMVSQIQVYDL